MTKLTSIVYASAAVRLFSEEELVRMLKKCRINNEKANITGMLLYKGGNFIQVLEGPDEAVTRLYDKIQKDPRHDSIMTLMKQSISERQFPGWEMGFGDLNNPEYRKLEGFTDFLEPNFTPEYFHENPLRAYIMLLNFKQYM